MTRCKSTRDWVDEDDDRRFKEEQEHARRKARLEKVHERKESTRPATPRARTKA